jgi:hypothetical protein
MSEEMCPVMLKKWFSDPCSQLWLNFVISTLPLFHDAIIKAQEVTAVESCMILSHLKEKLNKRKEENLIPLSARELLSYLQEDVGFELLTAMSMKMAVFWVVAPCSLVEFYQRFRGPCCLHHQGDE